MFINSFHAFIMSFKGGFRLILATICDQSCLNVITIEFRIRGDHEEHKILLKICLISSIET